MVLEKISSMFNWFLSFPFKAVIIIVGLSLLPICALGMIMFFLVMPLICNLYIVPEIERKTGKKLGYSSIFSLTPGGRFLGRGLEISKYILAIYRAKKKYGEVGLPHDHGRYSLKKIGYTIDMVSRRELIFSYVYQINYKITWVAFVMGALAGYLVRHYP